MSIFMLAGLLMVTLFVFASSKKLLNEGLVVDDNGTYRQISSTPGGFPGGIDLQMSSSGLQVKVTDEAGAAHNLYYFDGSSNYSPVYTTGW